MLKDLALEPRVEGLLHGGTLHLMGADVVSGRSGNRRRDIPSSLVFFRSARKSCRNYPGTFPFALCTSRPGCTDINPITREQPDPLADTRPQLVVKARKLTMIAGVACAIAASAATSFGRCSVVTNRMTGNPFPWSARVF